MVGGITWDSDGRTFAGDGLGGKVAHVQGQFLGSSFALVIIPPAKPDEGAAQVSCSASLSLPKGAAMLSGPLRCEGLDPVAANYFARPIAVAA